MLEFNESVDVSEGTERKLKYLIQRGLNFASAHGGGKMIEVVNFSMSNGIANLHLRMTSTDLVVEGS